MIVEFIGSTGAGKTTLIGEVQRRLAPQAPTMTSYGLLAETLRLPRLAHPTLRNLVQDVVAWPYFLASVYHHRAFLAQSLVSLFRNRNSALYALNYLRSVIRKIGMYEFARRYGRDRIILVDEGTVSSAHLFFVFTPVASPQVDLDRFARVVALPDLVVYVRVSVERLVERSLQRKDAPRELRSGNRQRVATYVRRAAAMFDQLAETEGIRERLFVVGNSEATDEAPRAVVDHIVARISGYPQPVSPSFAVAEARV